jgi:hypothetical protein
MSPPASFPFLFLFYHKVRWYSFDNFTHNYFDTRFEVFMAEKIEVVF